MNKPIHGVQCPGCGKLVEERALACPNCGAKLTVDQPGDTAPTKHPPIELPPPDPSEPLER